MTPLLSVPPGWLAGGTLLLAFLPPEMMAGWPMWGLRGLALYQLFSVLAACRSQPVRLSPLLLLGAGTILLYSLFPIAMFLVFLSTGASAVSIGIQDGNVMNFQLYVGSPAEALVLQFGLLLLAGHYFFSSTVVRPLSRVRFPNWMFAAFSGAILAIAVLFWGMRIGWLDRSQSGTLTNLAIPLASALAAALVCHSHTGRFQRAVAFLSIAVCLGAMVSAWQGKGPVLIFTALLLLSLDLRGRPLSVRKLLPPLLLGGAVVLVIISHLRFGSDVPWGGGDALHRSLRMLNAKLVYRQTDTGACLQRVIEKHRGTDFDVAAQRYLAEGLVPRVLWPDKPNLSLGGQYMVEYCGLKPSDVGSGSFSITLLGQPIIKGGITGLRLAQIALVLIVAVLWRRLRDKGGYGAIAIAAVTPWLVDLDQDMGFYVANAVKATLLMSPVFAAVVWTARRRQGGGVIPNPSE